MTTRRGLLVYAPVAPTDECLSLLRELEVLRSLWEGKTTQNPWSGQPENLRKTSQSEDCRHAIASQKQFWKTYSLWLREDSLFASISHPQSESSCPGDCLYTMGAGSINLPYMEYSLVSETALGVAIPDPLGLI